MRLKTGFLKIKCWHWNSMFHRFVILWSSQHEIKYQSMNPIMTYHLRWIFIFHKSSLLIHPPKDFGRSLGGYSTCPSQPTSPQGHSPDARNIWLTSRWWQLAPSSWSNKKNNVEKKTASQSKTSSIVSQEKDLAFLFLQNLDQKKIVSQNLKWLSCLHGSVYCKWIIFCATWKAHQKKDAASPLYHLVNPVCF